ncbi:MAG: hypothetical protein DBY38_00675 [Clostridium cadaveris]|uniref:Uncharacterized protein n=1 Tax=Clostridium cadaveris TaxID=1529 RepID=A0A316MF06_9CLOT|nr:MAG: hypothetical protein DBY38_00675 [Clostridium cadaveris]
MAKKHYYGKIEFYSITGKVMETIYYETEEAYRKEIMDSYEIGRPINPQKLPKNHFIENEFEDEMEM